MDFIEWCDSVLAKLAQLSAEDVNVRSYGADEHTIAGAIWGVVAVAEPEFHTSKKRIGMLEALRELASLFLIDSRSAFYQPTADGKSLASDMTPFWQAICQTDLQGD